MLRAPLLGSLCAAWVFLLTGCGSSGDETGSTHAGGSAGTGGTSSGGTSSGGTSSGGTSSGGTSSGGTSSGGTSSGGAAGSSSGGAAGGGGTSSKMPIEHVIVIIKENHTFDNYFGSFPGAEGTTTCKLKDGTTFPCPKRAEQHAPRPVPCPRLSRSPTGTTARWTAGKTSSGSTQLGDHLAWAQYDENEPPQLLGVRQGLHARRPLLRQRARPELPRPHVPARRAGRLGLRQPADEHLPAVLGLRPGLQRDRDILDNGTCTDRRRLPVLQDPERAGRAAASLDWKFYGTNFYVLPGDLVDVRRHRRHPQRPGELGQGRERRPSSPRTRRTTRCRPSRGS